MAAICRRSSTSPARRPYTLDANSNNSPYNPYVLWNFGTATSLTLNKQFNGGLLAPDATVSNSTPIEGSVAVANFNQGGEVHLGTFKGECQADRGADPARRPAPSPSRRQWALFVAGFGLIGISLRRRTFAAVIDRRRDGKGRLPRDRPLGLTA